MAKKSDISKYLAGIGAKGGAKRAANLDAGARSEIAKKAAAARWAKPVAEETSSATIEPAKANSRKGKADQRPAND